MLQSLLSVLCSVYVCGIVLFGLFNLKILIESKDEIEKMLEEENGYKPNAFCWIVAFLMSTFGWPIMAYQALTRKD